MRLLRQLSTGPDGVRYEGVGDDGASIEVERLFLAFRQPERRAELEGRLAVVTELDHAGLLPVRAALDEADPQLVRPASAGTLRDAGGLGLEQAISIVSRLAVAVAEMHRMGLAHGALRPAAVHLEPPDRPRIDASGTRTGATVSPDDLDRVCRPPEGGGATLPADVFAVGAIAASLLCGRPTASVADAEQLASEPASRRLGSLLVEMLDPDPAGRPAMQEVVTRLGRAEATEVVGSEEATVALPTRSSDDRLGRYELSELVGKGAMGRVYRARDVASGAVVALKILHPGLTEDDKAIKRFYREARVLAELDNDFIARFIEVNQDAGRHFLAMEFVDGESLDAVIERLGPLPVPFSMSVIRDVARALADVHDLGVVHRDIKPANIMLVEPASEDGDEGRRVKLCDFGIVTAHEGDEELTRAGLAMGTPHYMAPEQCAGQDVGAPSDVYALGISLYKMLAGEVPFNAPDVRAIVFKHLREDPPDLRGRRDDLDEEVIGLLGRMLAKDPTERIPDARTLLDAVERAQRGAPEGMDNHPRRPERAKIRRYPFQWQLRSTPEELWPHVSHTERLNRAIGLGAVEFERRIEDGVVHTYGKLQVSGMNLEWREHPYEWVAPRRMGILREFSSGPFVWLRSTVELEPQGGGTLLTHTIEVEPRGVMGRAAAAMEVGYKTKKSLERVYRRIDRYVRGGDAHLEEATNVVEGTGGDPLVDAFEPPPPLSSEQIHRLESGLDALLERDVDPTVATKLAHHLRHAPAQEVGRIRPRALARRFAVDHREMLRVCLHATHLGLLTMLWDVICPRCQIPADIASSLAKLREEHRCETCNLDFEIDFGNAVEIMFRVHPRVRQSELGVYCIGGPGHTPHVVAQVHLQPHERFELDLRLEEGSYQVAGRQLPVSWGFRVEHGAPLSSWELPLIAGLEPGAPRTLAAGRQRIVLTNDHDREVVARIERGSGREDAITAAEAACTALFRQLFPGEVLAPGRLVAVQHLTLLVAALADPWAGGRDEAAVFAELGRLHERVETLAADAGGAVVKIHGDGVLASFHDAAAAVRVAEALVVDGGRAAVHSGAAMATSINERLDYFGRVVHDVDRLLEVAGARELVLSESTAVDAGVASWLAREAPAIAELVTAGDLVGQRLRVQ